MLRAALTQTRNAYGPMPETVADLEHLKPHLDDIRRANLEHHGQLIRNAAQLGAQVVCLGELFAAPYFALTEAPFWREAAEPVQGPSYRYLAPLAQDLGLVVVAPIYELDPDTGRRFNTALVIESDGSLLGRFRKLHIPSGTNERATFAEDYYYDASDAQGEACLPVFRTSVGAIGVAICYDRHFEGVISGLAQGGAQLVFTPAVTFGAQSERLWEMEAPVEACRHRVFIGSSNRLGTEAPWQVDYFGRSYFVGPEGRCKSSEHPGLVLADLDLESLQQPDSSGWDLARDRRPLGRL